MRRGGKKIKKEKLKGVSAGNAAFLSVFILPILQSGSTVSASSGGQLRKSVVRKTKHNNGGKNYGITRFNTRCNQWEK